MKAITARTSTKEPAKAVAPIKKVVWPILWALPALWTGWLVFRYGVDIPHWDAWNGTAQLFEKSAADTLRLSDFFALHNEHRIFFPRLIMFGLARLTHWSMNAELLVVWLLGWVCAGNLWRLARVTGTNPFRAGLQILAINMLVFTPLGWENWLWGFCICNLLPAVCWTAVVWIAPSVRYPLNFFLTIVICLICTFTIGSGFTCWLLSFPLLLLPEFKLHWKERRNWWLLWGFSFIGSVALYFHNYIKPAHHPSTSLVFEHPLQGVLYLFACLGNPFSQGTVFDVATVAQVSGFFLLAAFIAVVVYIWRWRRDKTLLAESCPWAVLALVSLFNAAMVTIGRFGMGISQALPSRYMPFCTCLPIALVFLIPMLFKHWHMRNPHNPYTTTAAMGLSSLASSLALILVMGSIAITRLWPEVRHARLYEKAIVLCCDIVNDDEAIATYIHPDPATKNRIKLVDRLGYLRPGLLHTNTIRPIAAPAPSEPTRYGEIQQSGKTADGQFAMVGWAILPDKQRIADGVLLTYDNPKGEPLIYALAQVGIFLAPEVANALHQADYERAGWGKALNLSLLPPGPRTLRAWAFDSEDCRAYPLQGVTTAPP